MYKVIVFFTDLNDNDHPYHVGDTFPREGLEVSKKRLEELSGNNNKRGVPLIVSIVEETAEEPTDIVEETAPKVKKPRVKKASEEK